MCNNKVAKRTRIDYWIDAISYEYFTGDYAKVSRITLGIVRE